MVDWCHAKNYLNLFQIRRQIKFILFFAQKAFSLRFLEYNVCVQSEIYHTEAILLLFNKQLWLYRKIGR